MFHLRQPFIRRLLILAFLLFSLVGWLRMAQAIAGREWIGALEMQPGWVYFAINGAAWGAVGLLAAASLWLHRAWAPWAVRGAALFFTLWYWLDYALFTRSSAASASLPFAITITLAGLGFVWIAARQSRE